MDEALKERKRAVLDLLAALEDQDARLFAAKARALVELHDICHAQPTEERATQFIALDIAVACDIAQSTATVRLHRAQHLIHDLPDTHRACEQGWLRIGQALAMMQETEGLPREICRHVEQRTLDAIRGLTSGDSRRLIKRAVVQVDVENTSRRRDHQAKQRRVWSSPRPDGRAVVGAEQSAEDAGAFLRGLTALARSVNAATDPRTLDQQRADLFALLPQFALSHLGTSGTSFREFLGQATPGNPLSDTRARQLQAVILVPVETALDLSDHPAELIGYGPISADHARDLLTSAELRKACTDLRTGRIIALEDPISTPPAHRGDTAARRAMPGTGALSGVLLDMIDRTTPAETRREHRHDPSRGLADLIRLRDTRCVGPGCSQPAHLCDLEHLVPHPEGPTSADNLGPASRRCHNAKTYGGWVLEPHPDGSVTWTSPLGTIHHRPPRTQPPDLSNLAPRHLRRPPQERATSSGDGDEAPGPELPF